MIEIAKKLAERFKYLEKVEFYLEKIKEIVRSFDNSAEVYVFGSFLRAENLPSSDIDVLICSNRIEEFRTAILSKVYEELGYMHPFEIHMVDENGFRWYKKFEMKRI
ncbi:MAG: nucleotidyltransferase domain-containing protein [Archaeoglobaceae archaeon]